MAFCSCGGGRHVTMMGDDKVKVAMDRSRGVTLNTVEGGLSGLFGSG